MQRPFYSNPPIEEELCEFRFKPDQDEERKQARLVNKLHAQPLKPNPLRTVCTIRLRTL